jgi:hypothetical protein
MKTVQGSKMMKPIFIGRWSQRFCFRFRKKLIDTGNCTVVSKGSHSGCLPELYAASNLQD